MRKIALLVTCVTALSACDPATYISQSRSDRTEVSCLTQPQGGCRFSQSPLQVVDSPVRIPKRPYVFYPTAMPLNFVDATGSDWVAPPGTLTDGASIPAIFVSILGNPTAPEYINAAALHDAYCGIGNEGGPNYRQAPWKDVHVMFYDGLIVGGTSEIRAKIMIAAVWLGGPRWAAASSAVVSTQGRAPVSRGGFVNRWDAVPVWRKQEAMRHAKAYIEARRPPLPRLIRYLGLLEDRALRDTFGDDETYRPDDPSEESGDPYGLFESPPETYDPPTTPVPG